MQDAPQTQSIAGDFMPRLVARLHREGLEGTLRLSHAGVTRVIYFRRGDIASAASNAEPDRLPSILMRDGRLTEPQLEMARSRMRPGISLGKTLIEMGFLTPGELLAGARGQVRQILAACFGLTEGTYQVLPGPLPPEVTVLGLPVRRLIFDALMEAGDRQAIVREMGSMESTYRPTEEFEAGLAALKLDTALVEVARLIDGELTLRDISGRTALDDFSVSKIVLALEILGMAERAAEEEPAAPAASGRRIPIESEPEPAQPVVLSPAIPILESEPPPPVSEPAAAPPAMPTAPIDEVRPAASYTPVESPMARPAPAPALQPPGVPGVAMLAEESDDLPPLAREELPAFAVPPAEPPLWEVDPETGEKVHQGPIEMIFDGSQAPAGEPRANPGRWGIPALIAGLLIVSALGVLFLRNRPKAVVEAPPARVVQEPVAQGTPPPSDEKTETPPEAPAVPDPGPIAAPPNPEPPAANDTAAAVGDAPGVGAAPPPTDAPTGADTEVAAPPISMPTAPAAAGGLMATPRFADALRLMEAGEVERAAYAFRGLVIEEGPEHYTLQVLIACDPENVRKAFSATRDAAGLFVVPYGLQGRSCYRAVWGSYDSKEAARAAATTLPAYFAETARNPVVVSFGRLVPSS